tara:strand:+ start:218 stop:472 length:255 start_codon:yes stop_codon:yes gene_type:complete
MPVYLYRCSTCNEIFEHRHSKDFLLETREGCENQCIIKKVPTSFEVEKTDGRPAFNIGEIVKRTINEVQDDLKTMKGERMKFKK